MRSIYPSAALVRQKYALVSSLKAQGLGVAADGARPVATDTFLVMDGETAPIAARTLVVADEGRGFTRGGDGQPARIAFGAADTAIGNAFVHAHVAGADAPTAADPETLALFALAERVASADITVLINGPTGTGKEVLARTVHRCQPRAPPSRSSRSIAPRCQKPCSRRCCSGIRRAPSPAPRRIGRRLLPRGRGRHACCWTRSPRLPLGLQAKLLRVLQEREVVPIGATQAIPIDVRHHRVRQPRLWPRKSPPAGSAPTFITACRSSR